MRREVDFFWCVVTLQAEIESRIRCFVFIIIVGVVTEGLVKFERR